METISAQAVEEAYAFADRVREFLGKPKRARKCIGNRMRCPLEAHIGIVGVKVTGPNISIRSTLIGPQPVRRAQEAGFKTRPSVWLGQRVVIVCPPAVAEFVDAVDDRPLRLPDKFARLLGNWSVER